MVSGEYDIISPCILQPSVQQNNWKQMLNWGYSIPRTVSWIDLQAPMFTKRFIEEKMFIPYELRYGWGIDILVGILANKIGVVDYLPIVHLDSQTVKRFQHTDDTIKNYWQEADKLMHEYFSYNYPIQFEELREYGRNYIA